MAAQLMNTLGKLGIGLAIGASVLNTALYNGILNHCFCLRKNSIFNLIFEVDGGSRAVIFDRFTGVKPYVIGEGTHFLIPWVQRAIIYDIRSRPRNVPVITGSKGNDCCLN